MKNTFRSQQIGDLLFAQLQQIILNEICELEDYKIYLTKCKMNASLTLLEVGFSVFGNINPDCALQVLNQKKIYIRHCLAKTNRLKHMPELAFKYDKNIDLYLKMSESL